MKFLLDQDVYAVTARHLKQLGHDVVTASDLGEAQADDSRLLDLARTQGRIFVTRDKDFGGLVFVEGRGPGAILLRIIPGTLQTTHRELVNVLESYSEAELNDSFVVIEPGRHRFRKLT